MKPDVVDPSIPKSVLALWHDAQISHRGIASPAEIHRAVRERGGRDNARMSLALALQESETGELVDLLIDQVIDGRSLHRLLTDLQADGSIRRDDLVAWSSMFS